MLWRRWTLDSRRLVWTPVSLSALSKLLERHFTRLEEAYGPEQYPNTKRSLEQLKVNAVAKMKAEVEALNATRTARVADDSTTKSS
jgi:hypothetical protein